jgi:DNA-binding beta-propeller fold protein YncE/4-amino-4-deoxy-L-arabinose transferase-like glycosyltransferase
MLRDPAPQSWFDRPVVKGHSLSREAGLWGLLILAAVVSRFALLDPRVISHDEGQHVQMAYALYKGEGYTPNPMTHGPFQIIAVAFTYFLVGASDFSSRIPAALFGVAAVAILYWFRRWLGRGGALAAGFLMLISPYMLYYSRYVRNESFVVVWGLLMFYAIGRYLEGRQARWLFLLAAATALHYATKETAYIYVGLAIVFLAGLVLVKLLRHEWGDADRRSRFFFLAAAMLLLAVAGLGLIAAGRSNLIEAAHLAGAIPSADQMTHTALWITSPLVELGVLLIGLAIAAFVVALVTLLREFPLAALRESIPAIDLLVVLGTMLLPQLAALPMALFNLNPFDGDPYSKLQDLRYLFAASACLLVVAVPAVVLGLLWNRRLWLISSGIFFGIYIFLFSVCFTNFAGVLMGLVAAVNYWFAQQEVQRGSQPWYYYLLLQIPMYEYFPALLALSAPGVAFFLRRKNAPPAEPAVEGPAAAPAAPAGGGIRDSILGSPVVWMLGYWCVAALAAFTLAGEKMPWLTVHVTLGFILLGGWTVGKVAENIDWPQVFSGTRWLGLPVIPGAIVATAAALGTFLGPDRPFLGNTLEDLSATGNFVFFAVAAAAGGFLLWWLWRGLRSGSLARGVFLGAALILALLTIRTAWRANYITYDYATEFLVYAHGAPGVKVAMAQIEQISRETHDDLGIAVPYDLRSGWIFNWYLREYPNAHNYGEQLDHSLVDAPVVIVSDFYWTQADRLLSKTHVAFTFSRMWWPMMDYFDLTGPRIQNALGDPQFRSALWQIWFNRDYSEYARLTNENLTISGWPSAERSRLYVRKDLALQVWQYGSEAFTPPVEVDPYANSVRTLEAAAIWGVLGQEPGSFQRPRVSAVAPDGSVYIADTGNNRIEHFGANGALINAWGSFSGPDAGQAPAGTFNEPWGIAVGSDGSVYVADTWNFRIQKFAPDGTFLAVWGSSTNEGNGYQFYGPRAIAVDAQDRVFVADTGNKRIVYFDADGSYLGEFGSLGFNPGQFDEPVGLGFGPDGRLYVADTWNRRIQVFTEIDGAFQYTNEWQIDGWEGQSTDTKPYLAVSSDGRVWVTDPGNARVLVFDSEGNFLFTFGAFGTDSASFALPTGIAAGPDGRIYIVDTDNNRVMVYEGI